MKKTILYLSLALLVAVFVPLTAIAQENEPIEYASGTVVDISGNAITIEEVNYDVEKDEETTETVIYHLSPDAEFDNIDSIDEIKKGNDIEIDYIEKSGKKNIIYIYVYSEEY
jgi:hypothetical protein